MSLPARCVFNSTFLTSNNSARPQQDKHCIASDTSKHGCNVAAISKTSQTTQCLTHKALQKICSLSWLKKLSKNKLCNVCALLIHSVKCHHAEFSAAYIDSIIESLCTWILVPVHYYFHAVSLVIFICIDVLLLFLFYFYFLLLFHMTWHIVSAICTADTVVLTFVQMTKRYD